MFKKIYRYKIIMFVLLFLVAFTFQLGAVDFPVTVEDDLGLKVTLEERPTRIISLAPSNTEMLFALGLDEEIIAVTSYADYPEAALSKDKIGTITEPNIEKIITLKPDLIVAAEINKLETVEKLKSLGFNVVGFDPHSIDETLIVFKKIGKLTGKSEEVSKIVAEMYLQIAQIRDLVDRELKKGEQPKVFYEIWSDPFYTAGAGTFIDDIITTAGGFNIGRYAKGAWPQYSFERLLIEDPDVYISSPHSAPHQVTVKSVSERQNFANLKAVKNNRVYVVDQNIISRPSPRIIEGLKIFVKAIFPELTAEIDELD